MTWQYYIRDQGNECKKNPKQYWNYWCTKTREFWILMSLNMDWQSSENEEMADGYIGRILATALALWGSGNNCSPLHITFSHMFAWPRSQLMWSAVTFCEEVHIRLWGIGYSFGITHLRHISITQMMSTMCLRKQISLTACGYFVQKVLCVKLTCRMLHVIKGLI